MDILHFVPKLAATERCRLMMSLVCALIKVRMATRNVCDLSAAANVQQQPVADRQWTPDELKTMNQCKHHVNIVIEALNELEQTGRTKHHSLPAFPRKKLLDIMRGSEPQSKPLLGTELHVYLKSKIVHLDGGRFCHTGCCCHKCKHTVGTNSNVFEKLCTDSQ